MKKEKRTLSFLLALIIAITSGVTTVFATATGWKKDSIGWWYQTSANSYYKNTWGQISGKWY